MARKRVAILISGRGSNMTALIEAAADPEFPAEIALVLSNRADAGGLARAAEAGIATAVIDHKAYGSRAEFDAAMDARLRAEAIDLVCLAGFMRLLTDGFVEGWRDRMINIHPSLLPLFPGLHTHERAIEAGYQAAIEHLDHIKATLGRIRQTSRDDRATTAAIGGYREPHTG